MFKGHQHTPEAKKKIGEAQKGSKHPLSEITKEKISKSLTGKPAWNKSIKAPWVSKRDRLNNPAKYRKGIRLSEETRRKIGMARSGEKCNFWKGGISFLPYSVDWTETLKRSIRQRDNYICQLCSQYGNEVHHINYNKKNCDTNNLITLCHSCHSKTNNNRNYWIRYFSGFR